MLNLLRQPFDREHYVELGNVETLQRRLGIECTEEILEIDECGFFVVEHLDALDRSELAEDLRKRRVGTIEFCTYNLEVILREEEPSLLLVAFILRGACSDEDFDN